MIDDPADSGVVDPLRQIAAGPFGSLVGGGELLGAASLDERVQKRAEQLADDGIGAGMVVSFLAETTVASVVELLALWRVGAVAAPLNPRLTEAERTRARRELEAAVLPEGTQVVLWTSGTSGRPRGVALSWGNLEASAEAAAERLELGASDVWVASLSPAHVGGIALLTRPFILGGSLIVPDDSGTAALSRTLDGGALPEPPGHAHHPARRRLEPTHLSVVPTQLLRLVEHRGDRGAPANLRCVLVGGAHAPESLVRRAVEAGWPVALTYGATEMSSQIATAPPELVRRVPGTVGPPLPAVEVAVDASGELMARGPTRALGYVGEDAGALADPDGWYRTGDLGRIDEDGRLWITGRRSDRIVTGGVTVDAVEVEEALREHPTVIDACVVGVPDPEWGERVGAWIEPVEGELELEEIDRHLREALSTAKLPRLWKVGGRLPRNANGKVDRGEVRRVLAARRVER